MLVTPRHTVDYSILLLATGGLDPACSIRMVLDYLIPPVLPIDNNIYMVPGKRYVSEHCYCCKLQSTTWYTVCYDERHVDRYLKIGRRFHKNRRRYECYVKYILLFVVWILQYVVLRGGSGYYLGSLSYPDRTTNASLYVLGSG